MHNSVYRFAVSFLALVIASASLASDEDPRHLRHELMEDVGAAAKPVGQMLRGNRDFDAAVLMESLETFQSVASEFGDLFPEGSETGMDTEAAPAIWEDRAGFDQSLADWAEAVNVAIESSPQSLEDARQTVSPIFKTCKGCHDTYRIEN